MSKREYWVYDVDWVDSNGVIRQRKECCVIRHKGFFESASFNDTEIEGRFLLPEGAERIKDGSQISTGWDGCRTVELDTGKKVDVRIKWPHEQ